MTYINPFNIMIHPGEGFYSLRDRKHSVRIALLILALWVVAVVVQRQLTGFLYNENKLDELNIFLILGRTAGLFLLWIISNWSVCTLMDGSGSFRNIVVCSSYSLVPYLLTTILVTVLSNSVSIEAKPFLTWISYIGWTWSALLIFIAMMTIHEYSAKMTFFSIFLTLFGVLAMLFLLILLYSLFQQIFTMLYTIYVEISFRL